MERIDHSYRDYPGYGAEKWREIVWHLYGQKLAIVNLLGDRERERQLLQGMEILVQGFPGPNGRIELLMMEIRHLTDLGDLNLAEERIGRLFSLLDGNQSRETVRQACEWRALVAREKTLTKEALNYYLEAERYADNELSLAGIWLDKGLALAYDNQLQEAEKLLREASRIYLHYNSTDMLGDACNNLGICLINQERVDDALEAYLEAVRCYDRTGYKLGSAIVSGNVSQIHWYRGDYDSAFRAAEKCRKLGTEAEDQISIALSHEMQGRLLFDLGSYARSFDSHSETIRLVEEVGDRVVATLNRLYQAQCCSRQGDYSGAESLLEQCRAAGREMEDSEVERRLVIAQADVWSLSRQPEEALDLIDRILRESEETVRRHDRSRLLYLRARLLYRTGKEGPAADSFRKLQESLSGAECQSFLACVYALGCTISGGQRGRTEAEEHFGLGRQILDRICLKISDPELRRSFASRPEFKPLGPLAG